MCGVVYIIHVEVRPSPHLCGTSARSDYLDLLNHPPHIRKTTTTTTTMAPTTDFTNDERFDGLYATIASQTQGIEPLLDSMFSFLRRKTDFFNGPLANGNNIGGSPSSAKQQQEKAVSIVEQTVRKHVELYTQDKAKKEEAKRASMRMKEEAEKKRKEKLQRETERERAMTRGGEEKDVMEIEADGSGFDISKQSDTAASSSKGDITINNVPTPTTQADDNKEQTTTNEDGREDEDDKEPPPVGNGGIVDGKYVWTQTLSELSVIVPLPNNTRGKDLNVVIGKNTLKVGLKAMGDGSTMKGEGPIVDNKLYKTIIVDDSFWTIEDGNRLVLTLTKSNQMEWWECVCLGDPTINLQKVQPENSQLSDLDGETRQTVEKMMYDQRQKALGLPTAEEAKKFEILDKFKKSHPEMDFSQCKFN